MTITDRGRRRTARVTRRSSRRDKIEVKAGSTVTIEGTGRSVTIKSSAGVTSRRPAR